ncbi:hypothetical protein PAI11_17410 [Patulibacter medicamentivorans]|uniref:Uncharacterized protein n=1 Tax=Patulibacter medicamentivorans TaxID=1097667 RepID=H0E4L0_9ACTN|nr:hypothetical protein [Patulibacter medicamentivorans]EHN11381.1 hypothetical protein PAI11_17410 [Patulibacter medicamentivorans]
MAIAIHLPYYATSLRHDQLAEALEALTPELLRLGALEVRVDRSKDDAYRFRQVIHVASKADWPRIWNSEPFVAFRTTKISWYQKPLAYEMYETISAGTAPGVVDVLAEDPYASPADAVVAGSASA